MEVKTSVYYAIAKTIENRIMSGIYLQGEKIPNSSSLVKEFNTSEITIRKAMELLQADDLIERKVGIGTIVKEVPDNRFSMGINSDSFWDWFGGANLPKSKRKIKLLSIEKLTNLSELLPDNENSLLFRVRRVCSYAGETLSLYINYISTTLTTEEELNTLTKQRFLNLLKENTNFTITKLEQTVEVTTADLDMANDLDINFGDPLFFIKNKYMDEDRVIAVTFMFHRGDRYRYTSSIIDPISPLKD